MTGTVTDPSGAAIPGAKVAVTNVDTGVTVTDSANSAGIYNVRFLQIGRYKIVTTAPGFSKQNYGPFSLEIDQVAKVDVKLAVGANTTTVDVSESAQPILNTENATLGETFTENTINSVPLNGRDFSQLTVFTPGAVSTDYGAFGGQQSKERDTGGSTVANVNGNRGQSNNYILDGQEINENLNNTIGYTPSPDSLDQIRVISSNANAEFGNVNGGEVLMVTKSGTNKFHGSVFGFLENDNLDANSWTNKYNAPNIIARNPYTQTIFGGTFGGPIFKDKLFFFMDYEGYREHTGGTTQFSVAPAAFRGLTATANCPTGDADLSSLIAAQSLQLYNTQTAGGPTPYANNCVPITNPVAKYLFAHPNIYPLPNTPTTDPTGVQNNLTGPTGSYQKNDQADIKIDWHFWDKNVISARYSQGYAQDGTTKEPIPVQFPSASSYPDHLFTVDWTYAVNPAIVNQARASYARIRYNSGVTTDPSGVFGLNGNSIVGIPSQAQETAGFSQQTFSNASPSTTTAGALAVVSNVGANPTPEIFIDNVFQYSDNLTWQKGKHLLKFGAELTRYQQNSFYPGNDGELGSFTYTGQFTTPVGASTTYGFADFLLGDSGDASVGQVVGRTGQRQYRNAYFAQDDWKVTPTLTLNLGLRYEYDQPIYEVNNKMANINLTTGAVEYAGSVPSANTFANATVCPTRACYSSNYNNFMPRIGFSYQPRAKMVLRGGYGITTYLEGTGANLRLTQNPPFHNDFEAKATYPSGSGATYSGGAPVLTTDGFPTTTPPVTTFYAWKNNLQSAVIQEFSLTTEYQVTNTSSLQVGYVGEIGHHLVDPAYGDQAPSATAPQPYQNIVGLNGTVKITASDANLNYNALQAIFRQHLKGGLEFTANYTYAKALTDDIGYYGAADIQQQYYQQDYYNIGGDYGPAGDDVRHAFSATGTYTLPYGHGQRWGGDSNLIMQELLGGWKLSGSGVAYTGFPVTVTSNAVYSNTVNAYPGAARPQELLPVTIQNRSVAHWFGTAPAMIHACNSDQATATYSTGNGGTATVNCVFAEQPTNAFGNVSTGSLRAPGFLNIDAALQKSFKTYEDQHLDFRADFFNVGNIASYANPDNGIQDTNFGQITSTRSTERHIQLELKYAF
ncbi:TonB-dependent receptor [Granulicella sp. 5B5]|uniref:TonB-dependent receptor n=1 Tax=Granulicella sp. 5B5 TaxID=1617967 RepID=UPI0015F470D1|nr:TonB-dependent receptor [Granulicella sp. 5B5]